MGGLNEEERARAALSRLVEPGDDDIGRLLEADEPSRVLAQIRDSTLDSPRLSSYRARLDGLDVDGDLALAAAAGARLVVPSSPEWPPSLDDLGRARPVALWVRGSTDITDVTARAVAVVGARACTAYGEHVAAELAAGLGDRGWTVVSGAAFGIDAAAHRGALAVGAPTLAVLACGVDVAYPAAHEDLLDRVAAAGAVISELPPGCRPGRHRFLTRNRVIAALGRGVVVVEAALRSGAVNTAVHGVELSRAVMAVPGPVTSAMSAGCHELVRARGAQLVTDAADVLDVVGDLGVDASPPRRGEARPYDDLDPVQLRVLDALPVVRPAGVAGLAWVAGVDVPTVLRSLGALAAGGLAETRDGGWRKVRTRRPGG